jgi:hypothetical protein
VMAHCPLVSYALAEARRAIFDPGTRERPSKLRLTLMWKRDVKCGCGHGADPAHG